MVISNIYVMRTFLFLAFIIITYAASGQVLLNIQLPPTGLSQKSQLWNLSLVNSTSTTLNVRIELTVTDISNNQLVISGSTRLIQLSQGVKQLQQLDVMPLVYSNVNTSYNIDANPNGFLPIGVFSICYSVVAINNDAVDQMAEECEIIEVEPLSPPLLIEPYDNDSLEVNRPFFNWIPPSPVGQFMNLNYDFVLVETGRNQSPAEAIQYNSPIVSQSNIPQVNFQLPSSINGLDTGKLYSWRITARSNNMIIANSEVFSFTIKSPEKAAKQPSTGYYSRLTKNQSETFSVSNGILRFEYLNEINDTTVQLKIRDITSAAKTETILEEKSLPVLYGMNYKEVDINSTGKLIDHHIYLLTVTNARNESRYLNFTFRKN